ncbi:MAG TPA: sulfotransferase [Solirubrobacteraceae bacterium]|nr:sulfotransferase [Solirubrobacteraceae bacterium]
MSTPVAIPDGYGPPLVVAGIAGGGTRVPARLLVELGFFIGEDLNEALDNLTCTLLLKRPRWYCRAATRQRRVNAAARPLVRSLTDASPPTAREWLTLVGAMLGTMPRGNDRLGRRRGRHWAPGAVRRLLASRGHDPAQRAGWGWKEPNTIVLLPELVNAFPGMRFLHVYRDPERIARAGKDTTRAMVINWSRQLGLRPPARRGEDLVEPTLRFCRLVSERTDRIGRERLGSRYHKLDVDRLVAEPEGEIDGLLAFLGVAVDAETRARLLAVPSADRLAGSLSGGASAARRRA